MSLNVELLEQSFEKIKPCADEFATSFYENLFQLYPEVKPLFANTEMAKQQKKLINALVLVVENLRSPEALGASSKRTGRETRGLWSDSPILTRQLEKHY